MEILKNISLPALLEQTAEECTELAHACLKMSRKIRGENPTPAHHKDLVCDLAEESADVVLCLESLIKLGFLSEDTISSFIDSKMDRWKRRIEDNKIEKAKERIKRACDLDDILEIIVELIKE